MERARNSLSLTFFDFLVNMNRAREQKGYVYSGVSLIDQILLLNHPIGLVDPLHFLGAEKICTRSARPRPSGLDRSGRAWVREIGGSRVYETWEGVWRGVRGKRW